MGQKSGPVKEPAEQVVKEIRRATRRQFSAEEKIRIVLSGLRGEDSIAELCRCEGIVQNLYYRWSKEFLEAGKKRLAGDTARAATSDEVKDLRREAGALKEGVAELHMGGEAFIGYKGGRSEAWNEYGQRPGNGATRTRTATPLKRRPYIGFKPNSRPCRDRNFWERLTNSNAGVKDLSWSQMRFTSTTWNLLADIGIKS